MHACLLCYSADIQTMLNLHTKYKTEKQKLTDQAFVEDDEKTEIEAMLEKKYAEIDVKVKHFLCVNLS